MVLISIVLPQSLLADVKLPKFGKVELEQVNQSQCPIDSGAHAYYIFNIGKDYFDYNSHEGFVLRMERHFMIKILDKTAFDWADVVVPLFHNLSSKERVYSIKANTYNVVNGKLVTTKLDKDNSITDKRNDNWDEEKFTMPDVKEGSVVEVQYTIYSPFYFNLNEWDVQSTIPILYSYYNVRIPEYFTYHQTQRGYLVVDFSSERKNGSIALKSGSQVDFTENSYTLQRNDVPAFKKEAFLRSAGNYISAIKFELSHIVWPNNEREYFSTDWEKVNKTLLEHGELGERLKLEGFTQDVVEELKAKNLAQNELLNEAFTYVKNHYNWNGTRTIYTSGPLRAAFKDRTGNSADINYGLVVFLRELGFHACPVMLSTTDHGMIMPTNPSITSFNYCVAAVEIDGKYHFMDACDKYSEVDLLPYFCLNYKGRTIEDGNCNWVDMMPSKSDLSQKAYSLKLLENGSLTGQAKYSDMQYAAYKRRKAIKENGSNQEYIDKLQEAHDELKIHGYSFTNLDTIGEALVTKLDLSLENVVQSAGDLMLLNPLLFHGLNENPFKMEKREYPVEFNTPEVSTITVQIELPEGYVLEEAPKPFRMVLPDKSASFLFSVSTMGNFVIINRSFSRKKCQYLPTDYLALKAFYDGMIQKESLSLVIKKSDALSAMLSDKP